MAVPVGLEYPEYACTICQGQFNIENEGGSVGHIGILPVAFCPTCQAGIFDFVAQYSPGQECPHCHRFIEPDDN